MRIVAVVALALISLASPARADEYGPHPAIRAIRGALPVLLARHLKVLGTPGPLTVPDIVVDGDAAIATWNHGSARGLVLLNYHPNGWWMTGEAREFQKDEWAYGTVSNFPDCPQGPGDGLNSGDIRRELNASQHLLDLATAHIPEIAQGDARIRANGGTMRPWHYDCYNAPANVLDSTLGGYRATITSAPHSSGSVLSEFTFRGRAPTESEMPPSRGADAVYFFTLQSSVAKKLFVEAGSTLDVWAPFVLDPHLRYTLTLALGDPTIGPLAGTVSDNTMHFTLPAFSAPPSVELMGEIDADP